MSRTSSALEQELRELGRFAIRHTAVADQIILTAMVRSVPIVLYLDADTYPAVPPRMELSGQWSWGRGGPQIEGLHSLDNWNRTLGIGTLLRELEKAFSAEPPRRRRIAPGEGFLARLWQSIFGWLRREVQQLFGRSETAAADETSMTEAIRIRYQEIIVDKASRIERYKQAVAQLMTQWQGKTAKLEALGNAIERLEEEQEATLAAAKRIVEKREAAGRAAAEIKKDVAYRRCLDAFEDRSAELEQRRQRFADLEADAEKHHEKLREHEAQLEGLIDELQQLRDEFSEVAADLTTVELEKEIVDLRAGLSKSEADEELRQLMRKFRKTKASVRITKEAADLDDDAQDAEYLDVVRKVSAAREFENSLGLDEARPAERRQRE